MLAAAPTALPAQSHDTLAVGTYAYGTVDRRAAVSPLAEYLGNALQRPVRVVVAPDPVALADSVQRERVDVVVTNTFGYLLLADAVPQRAVAVSVFHVPPGVRTHCSAVLATTDDGLRDLAALKAKAHTTAVAFVSPGSTTGNLVPRLALAARGVGDLDAQVRRVTYAGTHAAAFDLLRTGAVQVAGLATEEYERQLARLTHSERTRFRVLWESPDIRLGPVAVRASLPATVRERVRTALVGLEQRDLPAFAALRAGWTEARLADGLVAATDSSYAEVRQLFGQGETLAALIARFSR